MATTEAPAEYTFKAEIQQLLHILVHSLYKEQEIFLRELISNASDALTRLHFEMLTNKEVFDPEAELAIRIEPAAEDSEEKWLIIRDSGIGMTREELARNLGTIAQSGAREFLKRVRARRRRLGRRGRPERRGQHDRAVWRRLLLGVHGGRGGARGVAQLPAGGRSCRLGFERG